MKKINFGVLGVSGHFTRRVALPVMRSVSVGIEGIASRDQVRARACAEQFSIARVFDDYEALVTSPDIDAVYIPLPNHLHLEWIKRAADAGKHILCEKPLGLNADQAREAVAYAAKKKVLLAEAFMYKSHPLWIHARELVQAGEIGAIRSIHTDFFYSNPDPKNIRNIKSAGGGALLDIGCYAISIPRFLLGQEPSRVTARFAIDPVFQTDVLSSGLLDFGATQASFTVGTLTAPFQRVTIHGSAGWIEVPVPVNIYADVPAEMTVALAVGRRVVSFPAASQYQLMFEAFGRDISEGRLPVEPQDAVDNMTVIDALFKSNETGKWERVESRE